MEIKQRNTVLIWFTLCFLMITAFGLRINSFNNSNQRTVDEVVYYILGWSLSQDPFRYTTKDHADLILEGLKTQSELPDYFYKPLFKHPPVFLYLLSLAIRIFGEASISTVYVSCLMGSLMIPLVYLLGKLFFDEVTGLLAAFVLWLDPVHIICSQKIWMDTTLSFFMVLSIYFYAFGLKRNKDAFFILGGLSAGLAALTKYPGLLSWIIIALYAIILDQNLYRKRIFKLSLTIPVLMLVPWLIWNARVYGSNMLMTQIKNHHLISGSNALLVWVLGISLLVSIILHMYKNSKNSDLETEDEVDQGDLVVESPSPWRKKLIVIYALIFVLAIHKSILNSIQFTYFPLTSWQGGMFREVMFYFRRLVEFNFLYLFAFISFFVVNEKRSENAVILYMSAGIIMLFFLAWGNYQSRYILAALPFLIILGIRFLQEIYEKLGTIQQGKWKVISRVIFITVSGYLFLKINYINFLVSYPNDLCYF